jgi:cell shape-determining protein MreD
MGDVPMNKLALFCLLLTAFLGVFGESVLSFPRNWVGAQVNILPPLMVYAAMQTNVATVGLVAVLGGLWTDSLSANPLGVSVLPLFWVGLALHRWRELLLRELAYAQFVLGLLASALTPVMTVVLLLSLGEHPLLGWGSLWQLTAVALLGGCLTPFCFRWLEWLPRVFSYRPVLIPSFRPDRELKRGRF